MSLPRSTLFSSEPIVSADQAFEQTREFLGDFSLVSFHDPVQVEAYSCHFGLRQICGELEADRAPVRSDENKRPVTVREDKPFEPEFADLCRLHYLVLSRKAINVLEFGSGYSTAIMADAMRLLSPHFSAWAHAQILADAPFHVYSVEEEQRFLEISRRRLGDELQPYATISRSSVDVMLHDNRIATVYTRLPDISPDLIYLDGPSQFATTQEINGISFNRQARMPMSADLLRLEFFLEPGTLVVVDGRTANARFLKAYFKRHWAYLHDPVGDIHYFELQEEPLGPFNRRKLDFCLGGRWLLG